MPHPRKKLPNQDELKEFFDYDPITGGFVRCDGDFGHISKGYWRIKLGNEPYLIHRLIWKWVYNEEPDEVDHINGDGLDNRLINLRNVNRKTNCRNSSKSISNTSGFTGVHYNKKSGRWVSRVSFNNKRIVVGTYDTPQEAKQAREDFIDEFYPNRFTERHGK